MGTPTYTPLAEITLGSSAASVTFSSISQAYRDLVLVATVTGTTNGNNVYVRVNNDATSNAYLAVRMLGWYATTNSGVNTSNDYQIASLPLSTTVPSVNTLQFLDYSATDKHKSWLVRSNIVISDQQVLAEAVRWANTAAITQIQFYTSGLFAAGSTLALYGVAA